MAFGANFILANFNTGPPTCKRRCKDLHDSSHDECWPDGRVVVMMRRRHRYQPDKDGRVNVTGRWHDRYQPDKESRDDPNERGAFQDKLAEWWRHLRTRWYGNLKMMEDWRRLEHGLITGVAGVSPLVTPNELGHGQWYDWWSTWRWKYWSWCRSTRCNLGMTPALRRWPTNSTRSERSALKS